jgi:translation initiation factor IF-1
MIDVNLQQLPNQEFSIALENSRYVVRVVQTNTMMAITITKDDVVLIQNQRLLPNDFILRSNLVDADSGNFFMLVQDESIPVYTAFGVTQFLTYIDSDELEALNA